MKTELKIPEQFRRKLIEKGALEKFIANFNEQYKYVIKHNPDFLEIFNKETFISFVSILIWQATPEGFDYWLKIATMDQID